MSERALHGAPVGTTQGSNTEARLLPLANVLSSHTPGEAPGETVLDEFSRHVHGYVREYIQFADQKAGFLFAFSGALLVYEFQKDLHLRWLKSPASWSAFELLAFLSTLSLVISAALAVSVVLPRLASSHRGTIFFRSIAAHGSAGEYATAISAQPAEELSRELLKHSYDLAKICCAKYSALTSALWFALAGTMCGVVALLA